MAVSAASRPNRHLFPCPGPFRRSDLQTLGYCLLKWIYGALPWTKCLSNIEAVMELKQK